MGKVKNAAGPSSLVLRLDEPGMTPLLRAGLGGLAASLLAISRGGKGHDWPRRVVVGPGHATVEPRQISLDWEGSESGPFFRALFEASFQIRDGLVCLPGMFGPGTPWGVGLGAALQGALKRTFLQHGKSTQKDGSPRVVTVQPDDNIQVEVSLQPYGGFAHQGAWEDVIGAFKAGGKLAGWANPGAVGRHNAFSASTELQYTSGQMLATLFAIVVCLTFQVTGDGSMGALVIPEPSQLIRFAEMRSILTPPKAKDVYVAGTSDAVLWASIALRAYQKEDPSIASMHGVSLRSTAWASQQKSRVSTMTLLAREDERFNKILDDYERATRALPTRIIVRKPPEQAGKKKPAKKTAKDDEASGYFAAASALRGFIAENLAAGRPWYQGFATAKVGLKKPRFIHQLRQQDNLGALFPEEKKGLWVMIETTDHQEKLLIESVHSALRMRFGAISAETQGMANQTRKNRMNGERERWRLAFSKAKTADQVRAALADLWSRAGTVKELKESWTELLPLLHSSQWAKARDLALVALASYRGKEVVEEAASIEEETDSDEN